VRHANRDEGTLNTGAIDLAIDSQFDTVIDWEIVVADARRAVDVAVEHLRETVREYGRACQHLERLQEWCGELARAS
jgi:hypothetical protein